MEVMKPATTPDMIEGPEAFKRFTNAMKHVLSVPRETVQKKIEEHRKEVAANPNRRGLEKKSNA
jgi:hypothetical protein